MAPNNVTRAAGSGLAIALAIGALASPATASAAWTAPTDLTPAAQNAAGRNLAVDDDGDAVFTWRRSDGANDRIEARTLTGGVLGTAFWVSKAGQPADVQDVDTDADGDAVFTYLRSDGTVDRVQARTMPEGGALSSVYKLSEPGFNAHDPEVAVDDDGDTAFVWRRFDGNNQVIEARTLSASGTLSRVRTLSDPGQDAFHPQVAMNDSGDAVFTWDRWDGSNEVVQAVVLPAGGPPSQVYTLSDPGQDAWYPQVAVDPDGDAYFTWYRFDGTENRVQATILSAAGVLGTMHTISDDGEHAYGPKIAVDDQGDAVIVFHRSDGSNRRVQAVKMSPADTVGTPETLSEQGQDAALPQVAVDDDGDGVVSWHRSDGSDNRTQAATLSSVGVFGAPSTLSAAGGTTFGGHVGVDADGDAVVAWDRFDGVNWQVQYSAGP